VLELGLIIFDIGGRAFFNSRPGAGPTVGKLLDDLLLVGRIWLNNLTLLRCGAPGSSELCLGTTWPDTVLFRSPAGATRLLLLKACVAADSSTSGPFCDRLVETARLIFGASMLKSIPSPCIVRVFRIGACGGSVGNADTTPGSLRPGTTVTSIEALGPVGVSIASGPIPPPPTAGKFVRLGLLSLNFCEIPRVPNNPPAKLLDGTLLNGSGTSLTTEAGRTPGRVRSWCYLWIETVSPIDLVSSS
jgi:hypothetical protein